MNASEIIPGLWQGAKPVEGEELMRRGFRAVVLCAEEHQPRSVRFPGLAVLHAPNDDADRPPTPGELAIAARAAGHVARLVASGAPVLVTCQMGLNRSGLVTAMALHLLTGRDGPACVRHVQARRAGALSNPHFVREIGRIAPPARRQLGLWT